MSDVIIREDRIALASYLQQMAEQMAVVAVQVAAVDADRVQTGADRAHVDAVLTATLAAQAATDQAAAAAATSADQAATSNVLTATVASQAAQAALTAQSHALNAATSAGEAATTAGTATLSGVAAQNAAATAEAARDQTLDARQTAVTSAGLAAAAAQQVYDGIDAITAALSAATTLYDTFDDRFLGAKNAAPTLDNDGNALQVGALYWDTQLTGMQVWSGSAWVDLADNVVSEESARVLSDQQLLEAVSYATDLAGQVARSLPLKQATSNLLTAIAALTPTDSTFIVGNGTTFVAESGATVRTSLGLGDSATKNVGTSSSTVAAGDHVHTGVYQPLDADLTAVAELSATGLIERTGAGTASIVTLTAAGKALLDDADASAQRTTLGAAAAADLGTETDNRVLYDEELVRAVTYATDLAGQAARTLSGSVPSAAPASKTAPGVAGQLRYASGFLYLCVAKDTWKRVAITDEGWT